MCHTYPRTFVTDRHAGVLSEKQRVQRHYDFDVVVQWCRRSVCQVAAMASSRDTVASTPRRRRDPRRFAERVDLIVLLFDPFKFDISMSSQA